MAVRTERHRVLHGVWPAFPQRDHMVNLQVGNTPSLGEWRGHTARLALATREMQHMGRDLSRPYENRRVHTNPRG